MKKKKYIYIRYSSDFLIDSFTDDIYPFENTLKPNGLKCPLDYGNEVPAEPK